MEELYQLDLIGYNWAPYPKVDSWLKTLKNLPHYEQSHKVLNKVIDRAKQKRDGAAKAAPSGPAKL